jgi:solute carrier family 25 phosphate transporter 23/24/25/41
MLSRSLIQFLAGANAGAISRTLTAPIERIKIILQAQDPSKRTSLIKEFRNIKEESGFKGFFKGNGANVAKILPETALRFMIYDYVRGRISSESGQTTALQKFLAAGISGFFSHSIIYPLEIAKTRLSLAKEGVYHGIFDCLLKIAKTEGPRALYKGWGVSVLGIAPNIAVDLSLFHILRDWYASSYERRPTIPALLAFGSMSSLCGQLVAYPFHLMRTRLQSQGLPGSPKLYNGLVDCARKTYKNEGFKGFYRGSFANFSRNIPAVAISYVVYERIRAYLED